jgi:DNA polymerase-1
MIDYDVETTGLQPWSGKQHAFVHTFLDDEGNKEVIPHTERERIQAWFDQAVKDPDGIRCWNTKFDRAFADIGGFQIPEDGRWHDGMLVAQAIDERRSVALEAVAKDLFGEESAWKFKLKDWLTAERARRKKVAKEESTELIEPDYSDVPMEIMEPYALEDVVQTRRVSRVYEQTLANKPDLAKLVEFERQVMDALYAVEKRGLPAREDYYRKLEVEVIENLDARLARCKQLAGDEDFNPNSPQQIIAALKDRKADMSYMSEKNSKLSTDAENLNAVDDELAMAILEFRSEYKVLSTYLRPYISRHYDSSLRMHKEPFVGPDGRIHANYRQVGARTGRMSCSDPNMQNQPRDDLRLRYNIEAGEGKVLVACDLSNIEMVLFAAYSGEGRLLEAVRRGDDLHVLTATMLGIKDRQRPGGVFESARQRGKTFNFSVIYGGGLRTIKRQQRCTQDHARLLRKRYYDAYPEVRRLQQRIEYKLQDEGYIQDTVVSGRRFRVDPRDAYKATNHLVQGTAAALFKDALIKLHKDGMPVVALVHDEVLAEVDIADAEEAKSLIIQRLTEHEELRKYVPLRAEGEIVKNWSQAKDPNFVPNWKG